MKTRPAATHTFRGGLRWWSAIGVIAATWPLARLDVWPGGLTVTSTFRPLRRVIPTLELPAEAIEYVEIVNLPGWNGVRIVRTGGVSPVIFQPPSAARVLDALEGAGIRITREVPRGCFLGL